MSTNLILIYFFLSLLLSYLFILLYIKFAKKYKIYDNAKIFNNPRTITSGGLVIYFNLILGNLFFYYFDKNFLLTIPPNIIYTFIAFTILCIICFIDDLKPIDPKIKLIFQIIIIYVCLKSLSITGLNLSMEISLFFAVIIWVYITNIINFIDGVDGFANAQMIFIVLNIILISSYFDIIFFSKYLSLILLPGLLIFHQFNKPHAKIYLGDLGSITLGFIAGYFFLELLILGHYTLALSLIIYPLTDCSITLIKRIFNGHAPWLKRQDYFFSKLQLENIDNKFLIFRVNIIFNALNSFFLLLQIYISNYIFICNILLTLLIILIYNKKTVAIK